MSNISDDLARKKADQLHNDHVVVDAMAPSFITEWFVTEEMLELARHLMREGRKRSTIQSALADVLIERCEADPQTREQYLAYWRRAAVDGCTATLYVSGPPDDAWNALIREYARATRMIHALQGEVVVARGAGDIEQAKQRGRLAVLYSIQNADPIGDDLANVDTLDALGISIVQLTYNLRNRFGDGCLESNDGGLSRFGHALVDKLNERRMVVDVSHASPRTALNAAAASQAPIIVSHTSAQALSEHPRSISDEVARAVADKGGFIGVAVTPSFVVPPGGDARAERFGRPRSWSTLDTVVDHVAHLVRVAGEDHVGIATDWGKPYYNALTWETETVRESRAGFDWVGWMPQHRLDPNDQCHDMETWDKWRNVTAALLQRGLPEGTAGKLIGGNFMRLLRDVRGR